MAYKQFVSKTLSWTTALAHPKISAWRPLCHSSRLAMKIEEQSLDNTVVLNFQHSFSLGNDGAFHVAVRNKIDDCWGFCRHHSMGELLGYRLWKDSIRAKAT